MRLDRTTIAVLVVLFVGLWLFAHAPRPLLAEEDLYDHLAVARHLARGEGFLNDVIYPLSLAFPFASQVPQPLVHRPPLYPLLLTIPYLAAGGDPVKTLVTVRWLLLGALAATVGLGLVGLARAGRPLAAIPWLLILMWHPLATLMVDWGREEVVAGSLLIATWIMRRESRGTIPGRGVAVAFGLLAGMLTLLRAELFWVPWLWWVGFALAGGQRPWRGEPLRRLTLAAAVCAALCLPWLVRNAVLTGDPFFSLQAHAEMWKFTRRWPEFTVYQQLVPQPGPLNTLLAEPGTIAHRIAGGGRFVVWHLDEVMPWLLWTAMLVLSAANWRRERRRGVGHLTAAGPAGLVLVTLGPVLTFYALFSPSTKHLMSFVPILVFESCVLLTEAIASRTRRASVGAVVLVAFTVLCAFVPPSRMTGWKPLMRLARNQIAGTDAAVRQLRTLPAGPVFTDTSAPLWLADRAGVWLPLDAATEQWIRDHVPGMAGAPWVRVNDPPAAAAP
jgi:hypothetical protein